MFNIESFINIEKWPFDTFENDQRGVEADEVINFLKEKYKCIGLGRNRIVFKLKSGNYVLKFPLGCAGEADNDWEGCVVSNKHKDTDQMKTPKTKWIRYKGFICVIMEYIEKTELPYSELPSWCGYTDDKQVGFNKDGILLVYDFGYR